MTIFDGLPSDWLTLDWLTPDWPVPNSVKAVFTVRSGGCSNPPWDSMNLGDHVGDAPEHVAANRSALSKAIASRPVFLRQVHGAGVEHLTAATPDGAVADACVSAQRGVACTIMVADCLPVLLTNTEGTIVAAAHAGWRGLAGVDANGKLAPEGVLEAVLRAFQVLNKPVALVKLARAAPEIVAWLGPCIGPMAFEVGREVKAAFEANQGDAAQFFKATALAKTEAKAKAEAKDKYWADLAGLARSRLTALGITQIYGNDSTSAWCTVGNRSRFFSHRRDASAARGGVSGVGGGSGVNTTGRMAACIWLS